LIRIWEKQVFVWAISPVSSWESLKRKGFTFVNSVLSWLNAFCWHCSQMLDHWSSAYAEIVDSAWNLLESLTNVAAPTRNCHYARLLQHLTKLRKWAV
jgi:hypothetical protein